MAMHRRKIKLIRPRLQLRLIFVFVGMSALSLILQYLLFMSVLTNQALGMPNDGLLLLDELNGILGFVLAGSFAVLLPLTFLIGVLTTHRLAGPVFRFEAYLKQVLRGEKPGPCRLRKGDELTELCELINQVTEPLRRAEDKDWAVPGTIEPGAALPSAQAAAAAHPKD
jgi:signal peptidase II